MYVATVKLESVSPYGQGKHYSKDEVPNKGNETHADYEKRTWRNRMHVTEDGYVFIPPMAFKNCLQSAARYKGMQIKGQGKKTYTKKFEAGVMIMDPVILGVKAEDVQGQWLFVPSDGKPGSGSRVDKCFPKIMEWSGELVITVLDDIITPEILQIHLEEAGRYIGIGFFRPENRGFWGRFKVTGMDVVEA